MQLAPVSCQNCGASLEIPDSTRFVTCQFCRSRLAIQHNASTIYTELLGDRPNTTSPISENLEAIRIQNEIGKLDRVPQSGSHGIRNEDGTRSEYSAAGSAMSGLFLIIVGVAWIAMFTGAPKQFPFMLVPVIGGVIICGGLLAIFAGPGKAAGSRQKRHPYEEQRRNPERPLRSS